MLAVLAKQYTLVIARNHHLHAIQFGRANEVEQLGLVPDLVEVHARKCMVTRIGFRQILEIFRDEE